MSSSSASCDASVDFPVPGLPPTSTRRTCERSSIASANRCISPRRRPPLGPPLLPRGRNSPRAHPAGRSVMVAQRTGEVVSGQFREVREEVLTQRPRHRDVRDPCPKRPGPRRHLRTSGDHRTRCNREFAAVLETEDVVGLEITVPISDPPCCDPVLEQLVQRSNEEAVNEFDEPRIVRLVDDAPPRRGPFRRYLPSTPLPRRRGWPVRRSPAIAIAMRRYRQ